MTFNNICNFDKSVYLLFQLLNEEGKQIQNIWILGSEGWKDIKINLSIVLIVINMLVL